MRFRSSRSLSGFLGACLFLVGITGMSSAQAMLRVEFHDTLLDLEADKVPMAQVLDAIGERTGIRITSVDRLLEPVTISMRGADVEEALKRLLRNRNYVVAFDEKGDGRPFPSAVWVFRGGSTGTGRFLSEDMISTSTAPPSGDPMKRLDRGRYEGELADHGKLLSGISADPLPSRLGGRTVVSTGRVSLGEPDAKEAPESVPGPPAESGGIRIRKVASDSIFAWMGLESGDTVHDVNGEPISSVENLIDALVWALDQQGHARVDRTSAISGEVDPIYLMVR